MEAEIKEENKVEGIDIIHVLKIKREIKWVEGKGFVLSVQYFNFQSNKRNPLIGPSARNPNGEYKLTFNCPYGIGIKSCGVFCPHFDYNSMTKELRLCNGTVYHNIDFIKR